MNNEIILRFCISDFEDITHDEITKMLGVKPIKEYVKGQKRNPKNPNSPLIKENRWLMEPSINKYASFENQMETLLNIIESKIDIFKPLCEKYYCEISCTLFIYYDNNESTPSIHLDARYNNLIKELDIEFDVDLYVFPNEGD